MALGHEIGEDKCTIFSQDISQRSNKMLKLNLILNGLVSSLDHAIQGDTLVSPYHKSDNGQGLRQFDYVVSNPPFKMDFSDTRESIAAMPARFWAGVPTVPAKKKESMAIYTCFIQHVINSLKDRVGKGAVVVPTGFLTAQSSIEFNIRKYLVDNKYLRGVISMPSNIFANTGTNVSILFIDKSRTSDYAFFMDASKLGEKKKEDGKNQKTVLSVEEERRIIDTFNNEVEEQDFSIKVSYDKISEKKYSFSAGQYFEIIIEHIDITPEEFQAKLDAFEAEYSALSQEGAELDRQIIENLRRLKID